MAVTKNSTVVGVFHDEARAQEAIRALRQAGFAEDHISVVGRRRDEKTGEITEGTHVAAGAATGAAAGAGVAALWSLGVTFGMLPGIGPFLAAGPIAAALISAAGGAAAGGVLGALVGVGIPEEEAKFYESEVHAGRIVVTVRAESRYNDAWAILERYGAYSRQTGEASTTAATSRSGGQKKVQLHEEQLHVEKTPVQTGEVRVRKEVHTQTQNIQVPVEREEVVVERRPASGPASTTDIRAGEEVRIPVREEQVRVTKDNVIKEEVVVGKRKVTDTQQVQGQVRKEDVKVEKQEDVKVRETTHTTKK